MHVMYVLSTRECTFVNAPAHNHTSVLLTYACTHERTHVITTHSSTYPNNLMVTHERTCTHTHTVTCSLRADIQVRPFYDESSPIHDHVSITNAPTVRLTICHNVTTFYDTSHKNTCQPYLNRTTTLDDVQMSSESDPSDERPTCDQLLTHMFI